MCTCGLAWTWADALFCIDLEFTFCLALDSEGKMSNEVKVNKLIKT